MAPSWLSRPFLWLDQAANWSLGWLLGGGLHPWGWTLSDRLATLRNQGRWVGKVGCRLLAIPDADHCDTVLGNEDA